MGRAGLAGIGHKGSDETRDPVALWAGGRRVGWYLAQARLGASPRVLAWIQSLLLGVGVIRPAHLRWTGWG